jgi:hypothetical protein
MYGQLQEEDFSESLTLLQRIDRIHAKEESSNEVHGRRGFAVPMDQKVRWRRLSGNGRFTTLF